METDLGRACRAAVALADGNSRIVPDPREPGVYTISSFSGDMTYRVQVGACTCGDSTYGGETCKHQLELVLYLSLED